MIKYLGFSLLLIILLLLTIYLLGFILKALNTLFFKNTSPILIKLTGIIGTPIHELSHAILCILFFHHIDKIVLFQMNDSDKTLGYVTHRYNKRNILSRIGNFFIGIAPVLIGSILLFLGLCLINKMSLNDIYNSIKIERINLSGLADSVKNTLHILFNTDNFKKPLFYLYIFISISIVLHMNMSREDYKGSFDGILFIVIIYMIISVIFYLIKKPYIPANIILSFLFMFVSIYIIALIITLFMNILAFIFKTLTKRH